MMMEVVVVVEGCDEWMREEDLEVNVTLWFYVVREDAERYPNAVEGLCQD